MAQQQKASHIFTGRESSKEAEKCDTLLDHKYTYCMLTGRPSVSIADQVTAINKLISQAQASADAGAYQDVSASGFDPAIPTAVHMW